MDLDAERRFHDLLDQALDLDGLALESFLKGVEARDMALAQRLRGALETLDERLFEQPSGFDEVALEELAFGVPPEELSKEPIYIGPYRLLELLGTGGMGRVFLAEQTEPIQRQVAVKLLKTSLAGAEAHRRFQAEQRALARLDHPNIGRILDAGTTEEGTPYFAMERVDGKPLVRFCDSQKVSLRGRLRLMIEVCRGVAHLHRKQVLHRDLKPSNILVSRVDGKPVPKIIDFGIAKALDQPLVEATLATGGFLGTPSYMSPEALDGSSDLDTRTDVYSLGVLLYELLTGVKPFEVKTGGLAALMQRLQQDKTPRPSTRWGELQPEERHELAAKRQLSEVDLTKRLRDDLDWVVLKAMAQDREERYGSADALAEELQRYLEFLPLQASPPSFGYRLGKMLRRHRVAVAASTMFLVLAGSAVTYHLYSRQRVSDRTAQLTREVERIGWLQRVAYQLPAGDRRAEHELIRQGMQRIETTTQNLGGLDRGAGDYALGRGALALGQLETAREHLQRAWQGGYQLPEAALTLGSVLGDLYEQRLERSRLLPSAQARRRARQDAGVTLRDPAIDMLNRGRESAEVSPNLLEARITLLQVDQSDAEQQEARRRGGDQVSAEEDLGLRRQRLERVVELADAALAERPWLYEAHFLKGRALRQQAERLEMNHDLDAAEELLEKEVEAVQLGLTIGRSDPHGYLRLCRAKAEQLTFAVRHIRPGVDERHQEVLETCAQVRRIDPDLAEADLTESRAWLDLVDVQVWDRNDDPAESLEHAKGMLLRYLERRPNSMIARLAIARGLAQLGHYQIRNGQDPMQTLDDNILWLQESLELEPHNPDVHLDLGRAYASRADHRMNRGGDPRDDLTTSLKHGRIAVEQGPDALPGYLYLGVTHVRLTQYLIEHGIDPSEGIAEGKQTIETLVNRWPTNAASANVMANLLMLEGIWQVKQGLDPETSWHQSLEWSSRSLEHNPGAPFSLFTRGQVKMWLAHFALLTGQDPGEWMAASREDVTLGFEKLPNIPGPYIEQAVLSLAEARFALTTGASPESFVQEAHRLTERALEIDPSRADAHRLWAEAEMARAAWQRPRGQSSQRSLQRAETAARKAVEMEPTDAESQLAMARLAWRRLQTGGDPSWIDVGLEHCDLAEAIDPMALYGKVLRGALLMQDPAQLGEGKTLVDEALETNPHLQFQWGHLRR